MTREHCIKPAASHRKRSAFNTQMTQFLYAAVSLTVIIPGYIYVYTRSVTKQKSVLALKRLSLRQTNCPGYAPTTVELQCLEHLWDHEN